VSFKETYESRTHKMSTFSSAPQSVRFRRDSASQPLYYPMPTGVFPMYINPSMAGCYSAVDPTTLDQVDNGSPPHTGVKVKCGCCN
jgi:hypothetical protein